MEEIEKNIHFQIKHEREKKKRKYFTKNKIALYIIFIPLIILAIHFKFYFTLKAEYHASESVNPKATSYFLHASAITVSWINILHSSFGVSYVNPIMKPIILIRDYFFNEGEKYVNKDNAENAIWWSYNYARMYGFAVGDDDNKMAIENLDNETQKEIVQKLYDYMVRLGAYELKGIYSIEHTKPIYNMNNFLAGYILSINYIHEGNSAKERAKKFYLDEVLYQNMKTLYPYVYQASIKSNLPKSKECYHDFFRYRLLQKMIFGIIFRNQALPQEMCSSQVIHDYLYLFEKLAFWANDTTTPKSSGSQRMAALFKRIALLKNPNRVSTQNLIEIQKACPNHSKVKDLLTLQTGEQ